MTISARTVSAQAVFVRTVAACAVVVLASGSTLAQPARTELRLGVAGAAVAGAWNPLQVVVRDAPGATVELRIDAGGLERGEVPQLFRAIVAPAGGVQRIDVDLPLASWRRISWRIEQDGRVLASGALGARERDDRPLDLVLSDRPSEWRDAFDDSARVIAATAADLPARAAGWDGVRTLLIDGTLAAPEVAKVVTAATAGVRAFVPATGPAGYAGLALLVADGPLLVGAGSVEATPEGAAALASRIAAGPSGWTEVLPAALDAATLELQPPGWNHLPVAWVALATVGYAAAVWLLLRSAGAAGAASAVLVMAAAAIAAPYAAPDEPQAERRDALVFAAGGLGLKLSWSEVARLPHGEARLDGLLAPSDAREVTWSDGRTSVLLEAGGRAAFAGAPQLLSVPAAVHEAPPGVAAGAPQALLALVPAGGSLVRANDAWWLSPGQVGTTP